MSRKRRIVLHKKAVIFDLDGTLINSAEMWNDVDIVFLTSVDRIPDKNLEIERAQFLTQHTTGNVYGQYAEYLRLRYDLPMTWQEIDAGRNRVAVEYAKTMVDFKPNADNFLKKLKKNGYTLALATLSLKWTVDIYFRENENILSHCDLREVFDIILTIDDVRYKKPHPEIYQKALKAVGLRPSECVVFEDSLVGVLAAKNAGLYVIAVYDQFADRDREKIEELADFCAENYDDLIKYFG